MAVKITFKDNSGKVLTQLNGNTQAALDAMGAKAVNLILYQMRQGYGKPIRQTGDLQRDVRYEVEASGKNTVDVGNTLKYAPFVHEGTYKMQGRPYIRSALSGSAQTSKLKEVAEEYLKKGF